MAKYAFLSDEWMEAAKAIRDEYADQVSPPAHAIRMNQVVTDVPFGDGTSRTPTSTPPTARPSWSSAISRTPT